MTVNKQFDIFGRKYVFYSTDLPQKILNELQTLSETFGEPKILHCVGFDTLQFGIKMLNNDLCFYLFDTYKDNKEDMRTCFLRISDEDTEWTQKRNANMQMIFYRQLTFKPQIVKGMSLYLSEKMEQLQTIIDEFYVKK